MKSLERNRTTAVLACAIALACGWALGCSSPSGGGAAGAPSGQSNDTTTRGVEPVTGTAEDKMPDKNQLASRLRATDGLSADFVAAPEAELAAVPTPFFKKGGIVRVQRNLPSHPVLLFVGYSETLVTALTGSPDAFPALAAKAGLTLAGPEQRVAYVRAYFETTRVMSKRFVIVDAVGEIKPRPNLSNEDRARFDEIQRKHAATVKPVSLSGQGPWKGTVFALKAQNLVRLDVELGDKGEMNVKESVVEENVPIPYAR